jgi:hypothetical protein
MLKLPYGQLVQTDAVVRQSQPTLGMGIEFMAVGPEDRQRISKHVDSL